MCCPEGGGFGGRAGLKPAPTVGGRGSAPPFWIPACAGMTVRRPSGAGIPCDLASLARVPLRFAKGRGSPRGRPRGYDGVREGGGV